MSEPQQRQMTPDAPYEPPEPSRATAWVGLIFFASILLVMQGAFQAIQGLVALLNDEYFLVTRDRLLISMDFTAWGWTHLIIGLAAVAASAGLLLGKTWARAVAILVAAVSAVTNIAFLAAHPLWSTIVIALDILVIYAVSVHGREVTY